MRGRFLTCRGCDGSTFLIDRSPLMSSLTGAGSPEEGESEAYRAHAKGHEPRRYGHRPRGGDTWVRVAKWVIVVYFSARIKVQDIKVVPAVW